MLCNTKLLYFSALGYVFGTQEQIVLRQLDDNIGLIPVKLGTAKITDYSHTLLHYYDLNPIIDEINILHLKSNDITMLLDKHQEYYNEINNYLKLLNLTQNRVENKLTEIIPHTGRVKRGLINGLGSIFKTITGNLDASDGIHYEHLIKELQGNQKNLEASILKQNSLSLVVIRRFNSTLQQINHNEKLLESRINKVAALLENSAYKQNNVYNLKDLINQVVNVYEIIDSILQDLENSLAFSKLRIMHPSIIQTKDLYAELKALQDKIGIEKMVMPVTLQNTLLFEKVITLDAYVFNNRMTYIIRIPIMAPEYFDYFHLYSVPVYHQSLFKVVLPRNKFLLKNQLHYAYYGEECIETNPQSFTCTKKDLEDIQDTSPCEIKLLNSEKDISKCKQVEVKTRTILANRLESTNKWILVLPQKESVQLKCNNQNEVVRIKGTYLCQIPLNCEMTVNTVHISNDVDGKTSEQPILFPDFADTAASLPVLNLSVHLRQVKLDELHQWENEIVNNQPSMMFSEVSTVPSLWTILIYFVVAILCVFLILKKVLPILLYKKTQNTNVRSRESIDVELPRLA